MKNCTGIDIRSFLLIQISPSRLIPNQNFELINLYKLCNRRENQSDEIDYARANEKFSDRIKTQKKLTVSTMMYFKTHFNIPHYICHNKSSR